MYEIIYFVDIFPLFWTTHTLVRIIYFQFGRNHRKLVSLSSRNGTNLALEGPPTAHGK